MLTLSNDMNRTKFRVLGVYAIVRKMSVKDDFTRIKDYSKAISNTLISNDLVYIGNVG